MKKIFYLFAILILLPSVLAVDLDINKTSKNEVMIFGFDKPATFEIEVTNNGFTDYFSFYTFFGYGLEPRDLIKIENNETKEVVLKVYPREDLAIRGLTTFSYFIQGSDFSEIEKKLTVNIINLGDAFEIGAGVINPESQTLNVFIKNKVNYEFKNLEVKFSSAFFDLDREIDLASYESKNFEIELDKEDFNKLMAGFYTLKADISIENISSNIEEKIRFEEKDILKSESKNYGLIVSTKVVRKINEGNVVTPSETIIKKNIISRLFTSFDPVPTVVDRQGFSVYYTWNKDLKPSEIYEITVKTNWSLPILAILLLIFIIYLINKTSKRDLSIRKKVSFVNAKGGEFALKVTLFVEAHNYIENIKIIDRLPPLVDVYNKFGGDLPNRYHKGKKVFEWDFDSLEQGERRLVSYIIYSKVGIVGKFALPRARGMFKREGRSKEVTSNNTFFMSQARKKEDYF